MGEILLALRIVVALRIVGGFVHRMEVEAHARAIDRRLAMVYTGSDPLAIKKNSRVEVYMLDELTSDLVGDKKAKPVAPKSKE